MTPAVPASAPLEASDPQRARALKAKIRDRVSDVRRHLLALRTAMGEFGEDFELEFATPLEHDERGCVFRVVIAPDCRPATGELRTDIKDRLKDALLTSSLETWASGRVGKPQA
jgi:hypothetical protein